MYDGEDSNNYPNGDQQQEPQSQSQSQDPQAQDLNEVPVPTEASAETIADSQSSQPGTSEDLPEAGGKLDAQPEHAFDATPHPDWAAGAVIPEGAAPAPAGSAVEGVDSTIPASNEVPDANSLPGASDDAIDEVDPVEAAPELGEAFPEELDNVRRAIRTLRSNSAANQPGTFVYAAIQDLESVVGNLELSAKKSRVDLRTKAQRDAEAQAQIAAQPPQQQ